MKTILITLRILLGLSGILLLILGLLFWSGHALAFIPLHMLFGGLMVLVLWLLFGLGLHTRVAPVFLAALLIVSLAMPLLGVTQAALLPGSWHWTVQLLHLLLGVAAMGLGQRLIKRLAALHAAP
jgi:hypothetical protein